MTNLLKDIAMPLYYLYSNNENNRQKRAALGEQAVYLQTT